MNELTVKQVQARTETLATEITAMLKEYEAATGCYIRNLDICRSSHVSPSHGEIVYVKVQSMFDSYGT